MNALMEQAEVLLAAARMNVDTIKTQLALMKASERELMELGPKLSPGEQESVVARVIALGEELADAILSACRDSEVQS